MDFCSPGFRPRCGLLVGSCCCIGANAPTGACGGLKRPSIACAGLSVSCGKPILHAWRAGTPIIGALTLPGPSALYPGGPPFGTCVDLCSKTLLWVMIVGRPPAAVSLSLHVLVISHAPPAPPVLPRTRPM